MAWSNKIMIYLDKAVNIIFLNLLWLAGVVLGLGFFGVFPATYALFHLQKEEAYKADYPSYLQIAKSFFIAYKKGFMKMNGLALIYGAILYVLWIDMQLVKQMTIGLAVLYYPLLFIMIYVLAAIVYTFPVAIHTEGTFKQKAKLVLALPLLMPVQSIFSLLFFLVLLAAAYKFSIILPLCFVSIYIICIERFISGELMKKGAIKEEIIQENM
ncbi:YesL family protein [Niallia taxi]|uniref:YesL family protein n=1 Tax=Niallia taxi TaxID=2499688 RepID=UPI003D2ACBD2